MSSPCSHCGWPDAAWGNQDMPLCKDCHDELTGEGRELLHGGSDETDASADGD